MYKIKYLSIAQKDLIEIASYIADDLSAPKAAADLIDALDRAILRLESFPYSCPVYQLPRQLSMEYRMLSVDNYMVFYVVIDHTVEIHRIIYGRRNISNIIR